MKYFIGWALFYYNSFAYGDGISKPQFEYKKSEGNTPFQAENIRMLKEIGIFSISIPIVGLMMSIVCRLVLGVDVVETSVNVYGFTMGMVVFCLTQFFSHGVELEKDVDGIL